ATPVPRDAGRDSLGGCVAGAVSVLQATGALQPGHCGGVSLHAEGTGASTVFPLTGPSPPLYLGKDMQPTSKPRALRALVFAVVVLGMVHSGIEAAAQEPQIFNGVPTADYPALAGLTASGQIAHRQAGTIRVGRCPAKLRRAGGSR